jgi:hypothetical protein
LDTAWTFAAGEAVERPRLRALREACLEATPDTEDFGSPIGTAGSNAGLAVTTALHCCIEPDPCQAAAAATHMIDTLDLYGYVIGEIDVDEDRGSDDYPPLVAEWERQRGDLERLEVGPLEPRLVRDLRHQAEASALREVAAELSERSSGR